MGHSWITGYNREYLVRDAMFEAVLQTLIDQLTTISKEVTDPAVSLIESWHDQWVEMPPGCKHLEIRFNNEACRLAVLEVLRIILEDPQNPSGITKLVDQFVQIVNAQSV